MFPNPVWAGVVVRSGDGSVWVFEADDWGGVDMDVVMDATVQALPVEAFGERDRLVLSAPQVMEVSVRGRLRRMSFSATAAGIEEALGELGELGRDSW